MERSLQPKGPTEKESRRGNEQLLCWNAQHVERPSIKYTPVEIPKSVLVQTRNSKAVPTTRVKRAIKRQDWCSRAREKLALSSRLVDSATIGKYSELVGYSGGRYVGEAIAGHPHGHGQYYAPTQPGSTEYVLQYDGAWYQGARHGTGTEYSASSEKYTGTFFRGQRHGYGRVEYVNGDVYEGNWQWGQQQGRGRCFFATGDIFDGAFMNNQRQGLGVLIRPSKGLVHVWEYLKGKPQTGSIFAINSEDFKPHTQLVQKVLQQHRPRLRNQTCTVKFPEIELQRPNAVFHREIVKIRTAQNDEGVDSQLLPTQSFTAPQLEMLRHAFELLCADSAEDQAQGVYREQVAEIMVMAGLELSAPDTLQIITQLVDSLEANSKQQLTFEHFLSIIDHHVSTSSTS